MSNTITMPFGKYRGQSVQQVQETNPGYLAWMLDNTDIAGDYPDVAQALQSALTAAATTLPAVADVDLVDTAPVDLFYRVRGGGKMHEGASECYCLVRGESPLNPTRKYLYRGDENLSGSGKSGTVQFKLPAAPALVLYMQTTGGTIGYQQHTSGHYLLTQQDAGEYAWQEIRGGMSAVCAIVNSL